MAVDVEGVEETDVDDGRDVCACQRVGDMGRPKREGKVGERETG